MTDTNASRNLVFLDTETLGLHPDAPIWEFAAIHRNTETGHDRTTQFTIRHQSDQWLDDLPGRFLADYNNRYDFDTAFSPYDAAQAIDHWTNEAIVIGCNPGFDIERLTKLLQRNRIEPTWHYHPIDSSSMALGYLAAYGLLPGSDEWKSDRLSLRLGVDPELYDRHTALGDVKWVMAQFDLIAKTRAQPFAGNPIRRPRAEFPALARQAAHVLRDAFQLGYRGAYAEGVYGPVELEEIATIEEDKASGAAEIRELTEAIDTAIEDYIDSRIDNAAVARKLYEAGWRKP